MIIEIIKGLTITGKHLARKPTTIQYPEVKKEMPDRFRGRHHLRRDENGLELCIGCLMCAVVCPAEAIFIEADENDPKNPVSAGERFARVYEIDYLRCIFCGFCVDACPTDCLVMGKEYEMSSYKRSEFIYDKNKLIDPVEKKTDVKSYYQLDGRTGNSDPVDLKKDESQDKTNE